MGIRQRLVLTMAVVLVAINIVFWVFYYVSRENLEKDLDQRLVAVSRLIANDIRGEFLSALGPGSEESRTYRNLQAKLRDVRGIFDLHRMMIVDAERRLLVDAEGSHAIGEPVFLIESAAREMQSAMSGAAATTVVYRGAGGVLYKSGFAPIRSSTDHVSGVLVVEASAAFLKQLGIFRNVIILISLVSVLGVVLLGVLMSFSVVNPLIRLVQATEEIKDGRYPHVRPAGSSEIRFLSDAMGRMAESIRSKEAKLTELYEGESRRAEDIERYAQSILAGIANGIVSLDARGVVVVCNAEAQRILAVHEDDVMGRRYSDLRVLSPLGEVLGASLNRGEIVRERRLEYTNARGERFDLNVSASPLRADRESAIAVTAVITDETELLGLQENVKRKETLAAIGQMAAYVAHEVRNPLGSMKIHMGLLSRRHLEPAKQAEYIDKITHEINRLN
ncbi:MAG: PAS domain-containing protein, partial [Candidatus Krumholzibacteria bacterium]|nr:PAS domain-containing protein [Candidatus Krumholzibacteria bacterium]